MLCGSESFALVSLIFLHRRSSLETQFFWAKSRVNNEDSAAWIGRVRSVLGSPFFVSILLYEILNKHSVSRPLPSFPGDSITYTPLHFLPLLNNLLYVELQAFYFIVSVTTTVLWREKLAFLQNLDPLETFSWK